MKHLTGFDFETSGLDVGPHAILSIGLSTHIGTWTRYVLPFKGAVIAPEAIKKNGYSPELWAERGAVSLRLAMVELHEFLFQFLKAHGGKIQPLAHNVGFDRKWMEHAEKVTGITLNLGRRWSCSQASFQFLMDTGILPEGSSSLDHLATLTGQKRSSAVHEAGEDADISRRGYLTLQKFIRL